VARGRILDAGVLTDGHLEAEERLCGPPPRDLPSRSLSTLAKIYVYCWASCSAIRGQGLGSPGTMMYTTPACPSAPGGGGGARRPVHPRAAPGPGSLSSGTRPGQLLLLSLPSLAYLTGSPAPSLRDLHLGWARCRSELPHGPRGCTRLYATGPWGWGICCWGICC